MKEIDFLIFYEHKNREFESITLLKYELVRRGYTVEFFSFYEVHNYKKRKKLFDNVKIAVMPSLYHDEEILSIVYAIAGKVKNIVNLRWEQLFSNITEKNYDYFTFPKENAKLAYHCCWGTKPYEMLYRCGIEEDKIFISGPIHLDFLRNNLKKIYLSREDLFDKYNIDKNKECILFISSFSMSTMGEKSLQFFCSQFKGEEYDRVKSFIIGETESRLAISEWIIELANTRDCTIIYRPHPAEYDTESLNHLINSQNIRVIRGENIKQWILACDQVYTWYSTSVVEASVAGVPCAVLRPQKINIEDDMAIFKDCSFITNYEQFCENYDKNTNMESMLLVGDRVISEYYSIDVQTPAYMKTADVLQLAHNNEYFFPWDNFSNDNLKAIDDQRTKQIRTDFWARIVIKPFYSINFIKRVLSRVFPNLYYQYCDIINKQKAVISDREFKQMERKIMESLYK